MIDHERARRELRRGERGIDRRIVGEDDVDALDVAGRVGDRVERDRAVRFERARLRGGAVPHHHAQMLAQEGACEARSEETGTEDCDHAATLPRPPSPR